MNDATLSSHLASTTRFRRLVHVDTCASTQELATTEPGSNFVVWSDEQTAGRGRQGRDWHGAPGQDVELTFHVGDLALDNPALLATAVPAAFLRAIEGTLGQPLTYKWPNDILCRARKLSGVLIDAIGNPPASFLIGIGVNVNRTSFPSELHDMATSLALTSGRDFDRHDVVRALAESLSRCVARLERDGDDPELASLLANRLGLIGRRVHIGGADFDLEDRLESIDLARATLESAGAVELARVHSLARI